MPLVFRLGITIALLFGLQACRHDAHLQERTLYLFGTLVTISAWSDDHAAFGQAVEAIDARFRRMHRDWHAWRGDGELMRLNQAFATGEAMQVSDELLPLLRLGQRFYRQSDGLFNPAIGRLIALWGFHRDEPPGGPPPDDVAIAALIHAAPSMDDVHIEGHRLTSDNPNVALDLGAYAKGYALHEAIGLLRAHGVANAIVNAGGDLCVSGRRDGQAWRIGVRNPFTPTHIGDSRSVQSKHAVIASLKARDGECVMTSGNYERYREYEGVRYAHILDPRSGRPVGHVVSVTVISRDGALADAAATALSVAGPASWRAVAEAMGVEQAMLIDEQGAIGLTPAMAGRIELLGSLEDSGSRHGESYKIQ